MVTEMGLALNATANGHHENENVVETIFLPEWGQGNTPIFPPDRNVKFVGTLVVHPRPPNIDRNEAQGSGGVNRQVARSSQPEALDRNE